MAGPRATSRHTTAWASAGPTLLTQQGITPKLPNVERFPSVYLEQGLAEVICLDGIGLAETRVTSLKTSGTTVSSTASLSTACG
jgi:hypothetical protein